MNELRRLRPGSALLAAAFGLAACGGEATAPPPGAPAVVLSAVMLRDLDDRIGATGQLLAKDSARIAAEVPGQVTETPFDEGEEVEAGQVVMRIDPERRRLDHDDAQAKLAETRAALAEQERDAARIRQLHAERVASQSRLDQAETALKLARARFGAAEAQAAMKARALADADVRAPFAGLIARRLVSRGEYVQPGQALFELVALDPIEVEFHLAEVDSSRVRLGDGVDVRIAPYPEEVFRATVSVIAPTIEPSTRTLRVKALLENKDHRLRPGLFARADLGVSHRKGVPMIPEEAILQRADGAVVFRLTEGNRVQRRLIQTGLHRDGAVEVVSGLEAQDRVVTRGHATLVDGALVEPLDTDGSRAASTTPAVAAPAQATP